MLNREDVLAAWQSFLGRQPSEEHLEASRLLPSHADLIAALAASEEFGKRISLGYATLLDSVTSFNKAVTPLPIVPSASYFTPDALARTISGPKNVLLVGACMFDSWRGAVAAAGETAVIDHILFNNASDVSAALTRPRASYDYQIVQVPLRALNPGQVWLAASQSGPTLEQRLEDVVASLEFQLEIALSGSNGLPTFVLNYPVPQQPLLGRLLPQGLSEPATVIEEVNRALVALIDRYPNTFLLDVDGLASGFGRRFVQDDAFWLSSHSGMINDFDHHYDRDRLETGPPLSQRYRFDVDEFLRLVWNDAKAMFRTLSGTDAVKLVCVDLDDTMWRGVLAEGEGMDDFAMEGWPLGFAEALAILRKRGVILAVVSKNDEARVAELWPRSLGAFLALDDFAICKINWNPKAANILEAIAEANVLPEAVLFIDDNPVERAAVASAIPGIRTLGGPHLDWRRILLWSSETQVAAITAESARRNDMVQQQVVRKSAAATMSRETFLAGLGLEVNIAQIGATDDPSFARALELLNKTNQFNTTGTRWTLASATGFFADADSRWWTFLAADRFTSYGLVGVVVQRGNHFEQFVMSCRVFGLGVEQAVLGTLSTLNAGDGRIVLSATLIETPRNGPCRNLYDNAGWSRDGAVWISNGEPNAVPAHILVDSTAAQPRPLRVNA